MGIPLRLIVTTVLLASCLLSASPVLAVLPPNIRYLIVDTTTDSDATSHQACDDGADNDCSLRGAVSRAKADTDSADADHIILDAETYTLTLGGAREDANATGDLDVTGGIVAIIGAGAGNTTIDGNQIDRVLHIHNGALVEVNGVSVSDGRTGTTAPYPGSSGDDGGGIYVVGALTLRNCTVARNATGDGSDGFGSAHGGHGGGLQRGYAHAGHHDSQ